MPVIKDSKGNKTPGGHTNTFWNRVDIVIMLILDNVSYLETKRNKQLADKVASTFKIETRMSQMYIDEAKKEIRRMGKSKKEKSFLKVLWDLEFLFAQAKKEPDYKLALQVLQERAKILDLYPAKEIRQSGELTIRNVEMDKITDYGLERLKRGESLNEVLLDPRSIKQGYSLN